MQSFNDPNLVFGGVPRQQGAPLVIFLPGTNGRSEHAPMLLLRTIAAQGFRVVFLSYNDVPAVSQVCPTRPPSCSARFREERVFGDVDGPVSNPTAEAIIPRLAALLRYLNRTEPDAGWKSYLDQQGHPAWANIVVSGLSQGAGMAAYIAKRFTVNRVVLFSSPWDETGSDMQPAPWLHDPSATPPDRWWAERHVRENTTDLIAHAYRALAIPEGHIFLFDGPLPEGSNPDAANPYHASTVRLQGYAAQWQALYGQPEPASDR